MVKRLFLFVFLLFSSITLLAQNRTVTGSLFDGEVKEIVTYSLDRMRETYSF